MRITVPLTVLLLLASGSADTLSERARALAELSPAEGARAALAWPAEEREQAVRALLDAGHPAAVSLADRLWLHGLLPALSAQPGCEELCGRLEQYARFAPASEPPVARPAAAEVAACTLALSARDLDGAPLARARVQAWSSDYSVAFEGELDASGNGALILPAGDIELFVSAAPRAAPVLLHARLALDAGARSLALAPDETLPWTLHGGTAVELELAPRALPFLRSVFRPATSAGVLQRSAGLAVDARLVASTPEGPAFLLPTEGLAFTLEDAVAVSCARAGAVDAVELRVRLGEDGLGQRSFALAEGERLWLSRGPCDLGYGLKTAAGALDFALKAYSLDDALTLTVGAPLQPRVWHRLYQKRYQKQPLFAARVFLLDQAGHVLEAGRKQERLVRFAIDREGEPWQRARRSFLDCDPPASLDGLRYRIQTALPLVESEVDGEEAAQFESAHYRVSAPAFLEAYAEVLLAASDLLYPSLREAAIKKLRWERGRITIHSTMPRGVRAYASSNGTSKFNVKDLLRCVRLRDGLGRTPLFHEHLHTVGYNHSDYMDLAGLRLRRGLGPRWMRPEGKAAAWRRFLCEGEGGNGKMLARLLLLRHGPELFDTYLARRGERGALQARGLSEKEADCALFSDVCGSDLGPLFAAVHAGVEADCLETLEEAEDAPEAASGGFRFQALQRLLAADDATVPAEVDAVLDRIAAVPALRQRVRHNLRLAAVLIGEDREELGCQALRAALEAALEVDRRFFERARGEALRVLNGEELALGWI